MAQLIPTVVGIVKSASLAQVLSIGGTVLSTAGAIQQGKSADAVAQYEARQLEAQGKAENASAQREAQAARREKELVQSRARAVAAASGGGQDLNLLGEIEEEGELRAMTALWQGEERAKGRSAQAAGRRAEGKAAKRGSIFKAGKTLMSGGASFLEKYG